MAAVQLLSTVEQATAWLAPCDYGCCYYCLSLGCLSCQPLVSAFDVPTKKSLLMVTTRCPVSVTIWIAYYRAEQIPVSQLLTAAHSWHQIDQRCERVFSVISWSDPKKCPNDLAVNRPANPTLRSDYPTIRLGRRRHANHCCQQ